MTGPLKASDGVRGAVARSLAIDAHTAEVVAALREAGIPSVLLKGPSIARWLYTDGTPRPYGDTDLLVPDEQFREAERVLEGLGLSGFHWPTLDLEPRHVASDWARADGSGHVDLHWTLPLLEAPELAWGVISRDAVPMVVAGEQVLVPSEPMRALHIVLHAAHHGPNVGKTLEDLRRALEQVPVDTWVSARALAEELNALEAMTLGLRLVPAGAGLADRLSIDAVGAPLALLFLAHGASSGAQSMARAFAQPTWRLRARAIRARAFPPVEFLRVWDEHTAGVVGGTLVGAHWRRARWAFAGVWSAGRAYWHLRRPSAGE